MSTLTVAKIPINFSATSLCNFYIFGYMNSSYTKCKKHRRSQRNQCNCSTCIRGH